MKQLRAIFFAFVLVLPVVLYFSYHPILRLGSNESMNFELSLPLLWLVIFDIIGFLTLLVYASKTSAGKHAAPKRPRPESRPSVSQPNFWRTDFPGISDRRFFLFSLFPLFATLSAFWSANPLRALLTAGIIWLIFFAVFLLIYLLPLLDPSKAFSRRLLTVFFAASIGICLVCWLQSFLDIFGLGRAQTLLCLGCTYHSFGFPHPSGFAIEPQFMGNLLLAPTLTSLWLLVRKDQRSNKLIIILAFFFTATLFLTFSRGAIYAFAVALFILCLWAFKQHRFSLRLIGIPVIAFLFTLAAQGLFTVLGPTEDSFFGGVTKSIHQLSLGIIDLRPAPAPSPGSEDNPSQTPSGESSIPDSSGPAVNPDESPASTDSSPNSSPEPTTSIFDGYVAESTNVRLNLNQIALQTWSSSPTRALIGVGLGGAGTAMHAAFPAAIPSPKEIVQNEYLSLLLEVGLIGLALIVLALALAFGRHSPFWRHPALPLLSALIVAYLITLNFFSGLPNALQIYLLPPLLFVAFRSSAISVASIQKTRSR